MTSIVAVGNQKGGVGKTSVLLGLTSAASNAGVRTLVVDMDPQGNASTVLGGPAEITIGEILASKGANIREAVAASSWPNVDLAGSDLGLADREADPDPTFPFRLKEALAGVVDSYDLVLIDCQPSVGKLVLSSLVAADRALAVTEPTMEASQGVARFMETLDSVAQYFNHNLELAGIVMNKVPARGREADFRVAEIKSSLGEKVWDPVIPYRALMAESRGAGEPIHSYGKKAEDLSQVFDSYLAKLKGN